MGCLGGRSADVHQLCHLAAVRWCTPACHLAAVRWCTPAASSSRKPPIFHCSVAALVTRRLVEQAHETAKKRARKSKPELSDGTLRCSLRTLRCSSKPLSCMTVVLLASGSTYGRSSNCTTPSRSYRQRPHATRGLSRESHHCYVLTRYDERDLHFINVDAGSCSAMRCMV